MPSARVLSRGKTPPFTHAPWAKARLVRGQNARATIDILFPKLSHAPLIRASVCIEFVKQCPQFLVRPSAPTPYRHGWDRPTGYVRLPVRQGTSSPQMVSKTTISDSGHIRDGFYCAQRTARFTATRAMAPYAASAQVDQVHPHLFFQFTSGGYGACYGDGGRFVTLCDHKNDTRQRAPDASRTPGLCAAARHSELRVAGAACHRLASHPPGAGRGGRVHPAGEIDECPRRGEGRLL